MHFFKIRPDPDVVGYPPAYRPEPKPDSVMAAPLLTMCMMLLNLRIN